MSKFAENMDMQFVGLQILNEISQAQNWHQIAVATEALWRARRQWDSMQREANKFAMENGLPQTRKPTISELEEILRDPARHSVYINPDGSIRAEREASPPKEPTP